MKNYKKKNIENKFPARDNEVLKERKKEEKNQSHALLYSVCTQKSSKAVKRDAETGEVAKSEQQRRRSRKEGGIMWPPGKWRLGVPCRKARYLFMRFATLGEAAGQRATVQLSVALLVQFRNQHPVVVLEGGGG